jgi:hypothetical protein
MSRGRCQVDKAVDKNAAGSERVLYIQVTFTSLSGLSDMSSPLLLQEAGFSVHAYKQDESQVGLNVRSFAQSML